MLDGERACELLGMDPLYVANEGIFIAIVAPEIADQTVAKLCQFPQENTRQIIGRVVNNHPGQVVPEQFYRWQAGGCHAGRRTVARIC